MDVRQFLSILQDRLDGAAVRRVPPRDVIAVFTAPSGKFAGPRIRPKYLGDSSDGDGRYGLTRRHCEEILTAFDVTLPPSDGIMR